MPPDVLAEQMKIVFCSTAPDNRLAVDGLYYSSPGNKFWTVLYKIGLTPAVLEPGEYRSLLSYGLGLADLAKYSCGLVEGSPTVEFDCQALTEKMMRYSPQILCFNGKKVAKAYFRNRNVDYGWQKELIGPTKLYVAPSTSGSAGRYWDEKWWFELSDSVGSNVTKVDAVNYYEPDEAWRSPGTGLPADITEDGLIRAISDVELHYSIPLHIRNMFEIARALFVYGYLYYPFCTLAIEQALKSLEAMVSHKYDLAGGAQVNEKGLHPAFAEKINFLYSHKTITRSQKEILHDCRQLRNISFHPKYQQVLGHYDGALRTLAALMNEIWLGKRKYK